VIYRVMLKMNDWF